MFASHEQEPLAFDYELHIFWFYVDRVQYDQAPFKRKYHNHSEISYYCNKYK